MTFGGQDGVGLDCTSKLFRARYQFGVALDADIERGPEVPPFGDVRVEERLRRRLQHCKISGGHYR